MTDCPCQCIAHLDQLCAEGLAAADAARASRDGRSRAAGIRSRALAMALASGALRRWHEGRDG